MGWLWGVESTKSYVSFAKEPYKRDDILQTRPIISSILLTVVTPYHLKEHKTIPSRGGGLGSRPKKMYGERLGNGVEYHLMSPTPRR